MLAYVAHQSLDPMPALTVRQGAPARAKYAKTLCVLSYLAHQSLDPMPALTVRQGAPAGAK